MKSISKISIAIMLFIITFSCEESENNIISALTLEEAIKGPNNGILSWGNETFVFEASGDFIRKFEGEQNKYNFDYVAETKFQKTKNSKKYHLSKKYEDQFVIENPETDEYIIFKNIVQLDEYVVKFDVVTSVGKTFESFVFDYSGKIKNSTEYNTSKKTACPWCWPTAWLVAEIIEAIMETNSDDFDSNCRRAIEACGEHGVASIKITDGGWFGVDTCEVICSDGSGGH